MIKKKTFTEFDTAYNELTQWPLELAYKMYSEIIDEFNEYLKEKENEETIISYDNDPDDHVAK